MVVMGDKGSNTGEKAWIRLGRDRRELGEMRRWRLGCCGMTMVSEFV